MIPSGGDIDEAKRAIRASVIETASSRVALAEVRIEARRVVEKFCQALFSQSSGRDDRVLVRFTDEVSVGSANDSPK